MFERKRVAPKTNPWDGTTSMGASAATSHAVAPVSAPQPSSPVDAVDELRIQPQQPAPRNEFITLTCPSCGGKLQITKEIDRFSCAHCGNEHLVRREGGAVYLAPIAADIRQIRGGVDKTAAELAVVRLVKEVEKLEQKYNELSTRTDQQWVAPSRLESWAPLLAFFLPVLTVIFLVSAVPSGSAGACVGLLMALAVFIGCIVLMSNLRNKRHAAIKEMKAREMGTLQLLLNHKRELLARNRLIVDS